MSKYAVWLEFLRVKCVKPTEIHLQLVEVYGVQVMSGNQAWMWCNAYGNGRTDVDDKMLFSKGYQSF